MSGHLILITGIIYGYVCVEQFWNGNPGMGIAYFGYCVANAGLWMLAK